MDGFQAPSKIDLQYADSTVIFRFHDCCLKKGRSFYDLSRDQATVLLERIRYIERLTWRQLSGLGRKDGLTVEIPNSETYALIEEQNSSDRLLVERHYFHIRVEKSDTFRLFGYQYKEFFCITHIDPIGRFHHS